MKKSKSYKRYKIEAKNSELKHRHGYDVASSSGLIGMHLQGAMASSCYKQRQCEAEQGESSQPGAHQTLTSFPR
ncbi:hypothetical protein GC102_30940 [Paenibacillus sp. LMG 31460]|uniref:Transposase DDE domain-containing protein n=1 Tax=Paenibacillus germinis TaxID=2654979 RepID=A0ABX1ZCF4_9BACL|nr:hypothetical protein [Paenibacillus germinis]